MADTSRSFPQTWRKRTPRGELLIWLGWFALVALFVFCWEVMTQDTMWIFVVDAPAQAIDLGSRMVPPRWSYLPALMKPLWDTINMATLGTLLAIVMAIPVAFLAARNTTPSVRFASSKSSPSCTIFARARRARRTRTAFLSLLMSVSWPYFFLASFITTFSVE